MAMAFPFKSRLMAHINFLDTKGFYSFKVMRIKLLTGRFFLDKLGVFSIENSVDLVSENYNKPVVKELVKQFGKKIDVKKVEMYFTGGFVEDSYSSAILCGTVSSLIRVLYGYLYDKYDDIKLYEDIEATFMITILNLQLMLS